MGAPADLVEQFGPMVRKVAAAVARDSGIKGELDDLIGWGFQGLVEAQARFDPGQSVPFEAWAYRRVHGAVLDGVRQSSTLPRRTQQRLKRQALASQACEHATPPPGEVAEPDPDLLAERIDEMLGVITASFVASAAADAERRDDPEAVLLSEEQRERVREALDTLPERELEVLHGIYFQEKTVYVLAAELGVTASAISQTHAKALARLRKRLD